MTIDELMSEEGYEAVFIGSGAGLPKFMGISRGGMPMEYFPLMST